jgi:hypothetical protein
MQPKYVIAVQKQTEPPKELYIRVKPRGILGLLFSYSLHPFKMYASSLTPLEARFHKVILSMSSCKDESGQLHKTTELGRLIIIERKMLPQSP